MTKELQDRIYAFILDALHDPARREVLLAFLQAEGFPAVYPASRD